MDVADVCLKIVFLGAALLYFYDLLYLDIYKKKTKEFFVGGIGASDVKVENKYLRWLLKIVMITVYLWLFLYFPVPLFGGGKL